MVDNLNQKSIWDKRFSSIPRNQYADEWLHSYSKYIAEKKDSNIIDLGCGRGDNAFYLKENGFNVIACDFSSISINFINNTNSSIETRCFDMAEGLPTDINNVGVVVASLSTHYFSLSKTIALYKNIYDILEPFGYFIFRVNSIKEYEYKDKLNVKHIIEDDYYQLNDGTTKRYFNVAAISELLKDFLIIKIDESNSGYYGNEKYYIEGVVQKNCKSIYLAEV